MDHVNYFKDMFDLIPDYRKIVILMFLIKNDVDLLTECGYIRNDVNRLRLKFKKTLMDQNEDYSEYIKNEEESILKKLLNK